MRCFPAGTIEERIFQRQVSKQGLSGTVVDLGKRAEHTSFSTSELRDLFSLTDTLSLTHDLLNCSCVMDGSAQRKHKGVALHMPIFHFIYFIETRLAIFNFLFFLHHQLSWRKSSRCLIGRASSVVKATAEGRRRSISACRS